MALLPVPLHKRIYLLLTILVTVPMFVWGLVGVHEAEKLVLREKGIELAIITTTLKERLPYTYSEILKLENVQDASPTRKREILHKYLQPIVDDVAKRYPDFSLGFYSQDLFVLAVAPFNPDYIGKQTNRDSKIIHDAGLYQLVYLDKSVIHSEAPIVGIRSQFYENGQLTGTVWASYKSITIGESIRIELLKNTAIIVVCWLSMITVIWWAFRKIESSLHLLVTKLENSDDKSNRLDEFPQLIPILEKLVSLKEKITNDYYEKEAAKENMARLERLNLVSQMAAGLAHEMRNPLQVVMGYMQFMMAKNDCEMKGRFMLMMDELERMNRLITDFLCIARNKSIERELIHLNDIIQGVYSLIYPDLVKHGININIELEEHIPVIYADKKEVVQLILNLVRNAIEAMNAKGTLTIKTASNQSRVQLIIADTGCGIEKGLIDKIFDPFYTSKEEGTGLGLSVCKGIVDRHEGEIEVLSEVGKGTAFTITFNGHYEAVQQ